MYDHNLVLTCDLSTLNSLQLLFCQRLLIKLDYPNTDIEQKIVVVLQVAFGWRRFFAPGLTSVYHEIQVARSSSLYNVCLMLLVQVSSFVYTPKQKKVRLNLTRRNVLFRDKFKCQYVVLPLTFSVPPSFFQCLSSKFNPQYSAFTSSHIQAAHCVFELWCHPRSMLMETV